MKGLLKKIFLAVAIASTAEVARQTVARLYRKEKSSETT